MDRDDEQILTVDDESESAGQSTPPRVSIYDNNDNDGASMTSGAYDAEQAGNGIHFPERGTYCSFV